MYFALHTQSKRGACSLSLFCKQLSCVFNGILETAGLLVTGLQKQRTYNIFGIHTARSRFSVAVFKLCVFGNCAACCVELESGMNYESGMRLRWGISDDAGLSAEEEKSRSVSASGGESLRIQVALMISSTTQGQPCH